MHAHLEPVDYLVRVFADGDEYGDQWVWSGVIREQLHLGQPTGAVILMGVTEAPSPEVKRALFTACRDWGWRRVGYKRRQKDGTLATKWIEVPQEAAR